VEKRREETKKKKVKRGTVQKDGQAAAAPVDVPSGTHPASAAQ
jgi:hypothetical protein